MESLIYSSNLESAEWSYTHPFMERKTCGDTPLFDDFDRIYSLVEDGDWGGRSIFFSGVANGGASMFL